MGISITPIYVALIFSFCISITHRAKSGGSIDTTEARCVYALLLSFFAWAVIAFTLGLKDTHVDLMSKVPFMWQSFILMPIWMTVFIFSGTLRSALKSIAVSTPGYWFAFVQALRIGALGGIVKGYRGEITSTFVFWIGIPDFLFGLSAFFVGILLLRRNLSHRFLIAWNLVGFALIILPTFVPMTYWMNEPGFSFIFEYPMVLAPSIIIPLLISLNLLHAWGAFNQETGDSQPSF